MSNKELFKQILDKIFFLPYVRIPFMPFGSPNTSMFEFFKNSTTSGDDFT